ncbi:MAG: hypothetical protein ACLSVD_08085 [Eggerthellaceae bacterium]
MLSWLSCDDFEATGAVKADAEPIIDALRSVAGVRVACMLREQGDVVRGSLRARTTPTWRPSRARSAGRACGGGCHAFLHLDEACRLVDEALAATFASDEEGRAARETGAIGAVAGRRGEQACRHELP